MRVGFVSLHESTAWTDFAVRSSALDLATSPSWCADLRYLSLTSTPGAKIPRRPGMVPAARLRDEVDHWFQSVDVSSLNLSSGRETTVDTETLVFARSARGGTTLRTTFGVRAAAVGGDAWCDLVAEYFDAAQARAGVVVATSSWDEAVSECGPSTISHNGKILHPWPEQVARMKGEHAAYVGTRYMRFPRWGTLVSHEHLAALGGLPAVTTAVAPARTRSLSGGVFVQLTESLATAMSDECLAKQRAFIELAAPLLPPPTRP